MATTAVGENANEVNANTDCIRVQEEPTLTQLVEEGLEDAEDEEEDEVPV